MPRLFSRMLRNQIKLARPILASFDEKAGREAQDKLGALGERVLRHRVEYVPADGWPGEMATWAMPLGKAPGPGAILYLHGGGYVAGSLAYAKLFGGVLAERMGMRVFCLGYALAPEQPYPAALNDAQQAYRYLLSQGIAPKELAILGESAGGGLLMCLTHKLKDEGVALPSCLVAISPWADLTLSSDTVDANEPTDVALTKAQLLHYARCYAPDNLADKYVSPIFGDFTGFPPALVIASDDEILTGDAKTLKRCYDEAGGECRLILAEGMWHAYPLYRTPESNAALDEIKRFISEKLCAGEI